MPAPGVAAVTAVHGPAEPFGGDPEEDAEDRRVRHVRGALERLAEELAETSETLDRTIDEMDDPSAADGDDTTDR